MCQFDHCSNFQVSCIWHYWIFLLLLMMCFFLSFAEISQSNKIQSNQRLFLTTFVFGNYHIHSTSEKNECLNIQRGKKCWLRISPWCFFMFLNSRNLWSNSLCSQHQIFQLHKMSLFAYYDYIQVFNNERNEYSSPLYRHSNVRFFFFSSVSLSFGIVRKVR